MTKDQFRRITSGRFFWLLMAFVAAIVWVGFVPVGPFDRWLSGIPLIGILIAATFAARGGKRRLVISFVLNGLLILAGSMRVIYPSVLTQYLCFVILLLSLLFTLITTLSFVLTTGNITPDHIYGAICAYVLIAMVFATLYAMQILVIPGAFHGVQPLDPADRPWEDLLYFSFTTLSTVGYGDITPMHRSARAICSVEMLTGTFYVAVLIARLAGLYPPPASDD